MLRPLIAIFAGTIIFALSKIVECSDFRFEELIDEFKWIKSQEDPVLFENSYVKFPERSYDRTACKVLADCSEEECDSEKFTFKSPKYELYFSFPNVLLQSIFDYLSADDLLSFSAVLPELSKLIDIIVDNRIVRTFPRISTKNITGSQIDSLKTAAQLINHIYPNLDLKVISDLKDLGTFLAFSWIISNDSKRLRVSESAVKLAKFILSLSDLYRWRLRDISSGRTKKVFLNRANFYKSLIRYGRDNDCNTVIEILLDAKCIEDPSILAENSYWQLLKSYSSEKRFKLMFDTIKIENLLSKDSIRENIIRILERTDNVFLFKTYLSHEICEMNEDFLRDLISAIFRSSLVNIFQEIIINSVTLPYLNANPQLLLLPGNYLSDLTRFGKLHFLEKYVSTPYFLINPDAQDKFLAMLETTDSASLIKAYLSHEACEISEDFVKRLIEVIFRLNCLKIFREFLVNPKISPYLTANPQLLLLPKNNFLSVNDLVFIKYISTPFFRLNPDTHEYILKSISHKKYNIFKSLLSSFGCVVTLPSQHIFKIIPLLNAMSSDWKFDLIKVFWTSRIVYSAFKELTLDVRSGILTEIINSNDYYHVLAISISPFNLCYDTTLKNNLHDVTLSDDFFEMPISIDCDLLIAYLESDNFISHPELHSHYIFKAFETQRFSFLRLSFRSKDTQIPFHRIREIVFKLNTTLSHPYSEFLALVAFWNNLKVQEYFSKEREEFNEILKDNISFNHIIAMLAMTGFDYIHLISFDIIEYCLNVGANVDGIRSIWRHENFKKKIPLVYEKYKDNLSFIIRVNGGIAPPEIVTTDPNEISSSDSDSSDED